MLKSRRILFRLAPLVALVVAAPTVFGAAEDRASNGQGQGKGQDLPKVPAPDASAARVPEGYRVEVVLTGLTYPSSVEFDGDGNLYVAEAGWSFGDDDEPPQPRLLRVSPGGKIQVAAEKDLVGPVNDLLWHKGRLYISHRGRISILQPSRGLRDLVTGLPSLGDTHNNQMALGPNGKLYFGQGIATNSAVVGLESWLRRHPTVHDVPARDIRITGETFTTGTPFGKEDEKVKTSPFHPFGTTAPAGTVVKGRVKANGTILRMDPDGSGLEVYAWGLRNPYGVMWGPDGKLYVSENGVDDRGSRPIANAPEFLWRIKEGAWYGWPDYVGGIPVTDRRFESRHGTVPQFLLQDHPPAEKPLLTFPVHCSPTKIDVSPGKGFGYKGQLFLAFFGHMTPQTGGEEEHGGYRVVRIDLEDLSVETFFTKNEHAHGGHGKHEHTEGKGEEGKKDRHDEEGRPRARDEGATPGPRRLVDVRFSPEGDALYVADFGAMFMNHRPHPVRGTGVIWRITREGASVSRPPAGLSFTEP